MVEQNIAFWENMKQFFVAQQQNVLDSAKLTQTNGLTWTDDYLRYAHDQYQLAIDNCDAAIRNLQKIKR